jgi:type IV pilus assembly protein PilC
MAITTNKSSAKKIDKNKVKEQEIFIWYGVNRKGKKS